MSKAIFTNLMDFLDKLEQAQIGYTLARYRDEALMVNVAVPGERWEIEFLTDGSVEVERFISDGEIDVFFTAFHTDIHINFTRSRTDISKVCVGHLYRTIYNTPHDGNFYTRKMA